MLAVSIACTVHNGLVQISRGQEYRIKIALTGHMFPESQWLKAFQPTFL